MTWLVLLDPALPDQGIKSGSPDLQEDSLPAEPQGKPFFTQIAIFKQGEPQSTAGHSGSGERRGPMAGDGGGEFSGPWEAAFCCASTIHIIVHLPFFQLTLYL